MRVSTIRDTGDRQGADPVASLVAAAQQVRDWGFGRYWVPQLSFMMDLLVALPAVAREVPDLELGTGVIPIQTRHPMTMAQQALTANLMAGGRVLLGLGMSHPMVVEGQWGLSYAKGAQQMAEYLDVLMPAMGEGTVRSKGEFWTGRGQIRVGRAPVPPVWLAALGPRMLAIAGERSAGTLTWMTGPATLRDHVIPAMERAKPAGQARAEVAAGFPVWVTDDVAGARAALAEALVLYGQQPSYRSMLDREGLAGPADVAIVGSVAEVHRAMSELADLGVDEFCAMMPYPDTDTRARTAEAITTWRG
jgi:5,10-methylenetetrahydromethanopterin reductase